MGDDAIKKNVKQKKLTRRSEQASAPTPTQRLNSTRTGSPGPFR